MARAWMPTEIIGAKKKGGFVCGAGSLSMALGLGGMATAWQEPWHLSFGPAQWVSKFLLHLAGPDVSLGGGVSHPNFERYLLTPAISGYSSSSPTKPSFQCAPRIWGPFLLASLGPTSSAAGEGGCGGETPRRGFQCNISSRRK